MTRSLRTLVLAALGLSLAGCPKEAPPQANLKVTCAANGKVLEHASEPPGEGFACPPDSQVTFTYDDDGQFGFVTVFAVTKDDIIFWLPNSKTGESVAITPGAKGAQLPGAFTVPPKVRDIVAIFSKTPLKADVVDRNVREVTLKNFKETAMNRIRLSRLHGPVD